MNASAEFEDFDWRRGASFEADELFERKPPRIVACRRAGFGRRAGVGRSARPDEAAIAVRRACMSSQVERVAVESNVFSGRAGPVAGYRSRVEASECRWTAKRKKRTNHHDSQARQRRRQARVYDATMARVSERLTRHLTASIGHDA